MTTFGVVVGTVALGALFAGPAFAAGCDEALSKTLHVSMKFTKDRYKAGDEAHVTVTLTNSDSKVLKGVSAGCDHAGFPHELTGRGPGWAALNSGNGVDLNPGEHKTVDVWETVPAGAFDYGYVIASCIFGPNAATGAAPPEYPSGYTTAKVPGATVDYSLKLEDNGKKPIANTKIYALDPDTKQIVGRAVTDAAGVFQFKGLPVGVYQLYIVGPWQASDGKPIITDIHRGSGTPGTSTLTLFPGPYQPDLVGGTTPPAASATTTPATTTAATTTCAGGGAGGTSTPTSTSAVIATTTAVSAAGASKALPNTGADVFGPTVAGLALLAAGVGALLIARRRKATS